MRATDGLRTTITSSPVNRVDQRLSLTLTLEVALPMPHQDEHLPDQIEAYVHQAGLELQRRLFQVLIEKADQELVLEQRHGKANAGIEAAGNTPLHLQDHLRRRHRSARASATSTMARWRSRRLSPGIRPTN